MSKLFLGNTEILKWYEEEDQIMKAYYGDTLMFGDEEPTPPPIPNYLRFTARNGAATIGMYGSATPNVSYSFDGTNWTTWDYNDITIPNGSTLYMKGNNPNGFSISTNNRKTFAMSGTIEANGNIMSLLYDDNFEGQLTIPNDYCFNYLFSGCTSLTYAPELPATTLTYSCYGDMFYNCTSLTSAPTLPATTLEGYCYLAMFYGCTSLTTAPILPATTLEQHCYEYMFCGCTSLTSAPQLPATTLAGSCYKQMFKGCTSLTTAPELPATTLTLACYGDMFNGCTSLTTAPELPAITLVQNCYENMFSGCTSLNYIKAMFTTTPSSVRRYTYNWVVGVAATGTFVKNSAATWTTTGNSGVPTGWTIQYETPN